MDRRSFLITGCAACVGAGSVLTLVSGCGAASMGAVIEGSDLVVPMTAFEIVAGGKTTFRNVVTVRHDILQYPIAVYRFSATEYSALFMRCTHQGTELQAFGDALECPAHGSEFDDRGNVTHGPAAAGLRRFPVTPENDHVRISLK